MSVLVRTIVLSQTLGYGNSRTYIAESVTKSPFFESNIFRIIRNETELLADIAPPHQAYEKKLLNNPFRDIKVQKLVLNIVSPEPQWFFTTLAVKPLFSPKSGLKVKEYKLLRRNFSDTGYFGFGIQDHIELGFKYDPSIGIYGMNYFVVLEHPGNRVGRRPRCKARLGIQHRVTKDDAMKWFQGKYEGVILNRPELI